MMGEQRQSKQKEEPSCHVNGDSACPSASPKSALQSYFKQLTMSTKTKRRSLTVVSDNARIPQRCEGESAFSTEEQLSQSLSAIHTIAFPPPFLSSSATDPSLRWEDKLEGSYNSDFGFDMPSRIEQRSTAPALPIRKGSVVRGKLTASTSLDSTARWLQELPMDASPGTTQRKRASPLTPVRSPQSCSDDEEASEDSIPLFQKYTALCHSTKEEICSTPPFTTESEFILSPTPPERLSSSSLSMDDEDLAAVESYNIAAAKELLRATRPTASDRSPPSPVHRTDSSWYSGGVSSCSILNGHCSPTKLAATTHGSRGLDFSFLKSSCGLASLPHNANRRRTGLGVVWEQNERGTGGRHSSKSLVGGS